MKYLLLLTLAITLVSPSWAKDFTPKEYPIVGNTHSKIFHEPDTRHYANIIRENKHSVDNRICFPDKLSAMDKEYKTAKSYRHQ